VISTLRPLAGRVLAVGIPLLVLGAIYLGVVAPILENFAAAHDTIAQTSILVSRYREAGDRLAAQRATLAELTQHQAAQSGLLDGGNETLVAASLQTRIKAIVDSARGELKSTQILPVQQEGGFRRVAIRGEMSMTLPAVQQVLYALETASPLLFVDNVDIHSHAADRQQDRNEDIVILDMTLDIYGYMRGGQ
jgi:general secretion pathway protein M